MTCRELADFILDYLSGELPPEVRQVFESHLSRCENCREYLATYKAAVEMGRRAFEDDGRDAAAAAVPQKLIAAILAAVSDKGSERS